MTGSALGVAPIGSSTGSTTTPESSLWWTSRTDGTCTAPEHPSVEGLLEVGGGFGVAEGAVEGGGAAGGQGDVGGADGSGPGLGGRQEQAAGASAASEGGDHDLFDPGDRGVGVEGRVAGGQEVAGDGAGGLGDEDQGAGVSQQ